VPPPATNPPNINPPSARTPLAHWHAQHGARFDELNSWQVPISFTTEDAEANAARTGLAMADISFVAKTILRGSAVSEFAGALTGNTQTSTSGRAIPLKTDQSVLVCHLQTDQLLLLAGPSSKIRLDQLLSKAGKTPSVIQIDMTSAFAAFWLFGPHTNDVLRKLTHHDVAAMQPGSCAATGLAKVPAILVRPPTTATPSMRILVGWDLAEYLWEEIFRAGQAWNISPMGMDALDLITSQRQSH
jgi:glycine cleavage system T protein (aminomethyltransferase)